MTRVLLNPGTGPVPRAQLRLARFNIAAFAREVGPCVYRTRSTDDGDGRWSFTLVHGRRNCVVSMPGCPRAYLTDPDNVGVLLPVRLYVDGNSWTWWLAVVCAQETLGLVGH